jgi:hypothetical protein
VVALAARPAFTEILGEDPYRRLWLSGLCLNTARWMDLVVLGWLALQLTGSPFMVGLAAFARSAPMMALGPFAGVVADRMHRRRVLLFAGGGPSHRARAARSSREAGVLVLVTLSALQRALGPRFPPRRTALYSLVRPSRSAVSLETVSMQLTKWSARCSPGQGSPTSRPRPASAHGGVYAMGLAVSVSCARPSAPPPGPCSVVTPEPGAGFRAAWEADGAAVSSSPC